jgi:hypothetical protein
MHLFRLQVYYARFLISLGYVEQLLLSWMQSCRICATSSKLRNQFICHKFFPMRGEDYFENCHSNKISKNAAKNALLYFPVVTPSYMSKRYIVFLMFQ